MKARSEDEIPSKEEAMTPIVVDRLPPDRGPRAIESDAKQFTIPFDEENHSNHDDDEIDPKSEILRRADSILNRDHVVCSHSLSLFSEPQNDENSVIFFLKAFQMSITTCDHLFSVKKCIIGHFLKSSIFL